MCILNTVYYQMESYGRKGAFTLPYFKLVQTTVTRMS